MSKLNTWGIAKSSTFYCKFFISAAQQIVRILFDSRATWKSAALLLFCTFSQHSLQLQQLQTLQ